MHLPAAALTRLRERFAALCTPQNNASENAHVKKILMVGAVLENNELGNSDRIWLSIAMRRLHKLQIPVDPGFEIETLNLKNTPPEDFLESAPAADMVIICFIPYDIPRMKVSPHHHEPDIWQKAVLKSGAVILAVEGTNSEINESMFRGENFRPLFIMRQEGSGLFIRGDYKLAGPASEL